MLDTKDSKSDAPMNFDTPQEESNTDSSASNVIFDIPVTISAVLGKATMQVSQLLKLGRGAVVELNRKVGEPVDIYANNRMIARGEIVVVDDDHLGITMTEIIRPEKNTF